MRQWQKGNYTENIKILFYYSFTGWLYMHINKDDANFLQKNTIYVEEECEGMS